MSDKRLTLNIAGDVSFGRLLLALGSQELAILAKADGSHEVHDGHRLPASGGPMQTGYTRPPRHAPRLAKLSISEREALVIARELLKCAAFSHQRDATAVRNRARADSLCSTIDEWLENDSPSASVRGPDAGPQVLTGDTDGNVDLEQYYKEGPFHIGNGLAALDGFEYQTRAEAETALCARQRSRVGDPNERVFPGPVSSCAHKITPDSLVGAPRKGAMTVAWSGDGGVLRQV